MHFIMIQIFKYYKQDFNLNKNKIILTLTKIIKT